MHFQFCMHSYSALVVIQHRIFLKEVGHNIFLPVGGCTLRTNTYIHLKYIGVNVFVFLGFVYKHIPLYTLSLQL